eukprot:GHVU01204768.1.p1 GENE.GHVU01204768.1~~GHVU01204768.1.p1  ORF type:complete len:107 (-),score=0.47 GHVU01204768.1:40-360(-)
MNQRERGLWTLALIRRAGCHCAMFVCLLCHQGRQMKPKETLLASDEIRTLPLVLLVLPCPVSRGGVLRGTGLGPPATCAARDFRLHSEEGEREISSASAQRNVRMT